MRLNGKRSWIARGWALTVAAFLVLSACGGNGGTTREGASPTPPSTSEPAAESDPLEGEWRAEITCEESVRAIESHLSPKQLREQIGSLESFMAEGPWGATPTADDPCQGATGTMVLLVRFAGGDLALFDAETGEIGAQATYEVVGEDEIIVNDPEENLCGGTLGCPVTWRFALTGDELTFDVGPDVFVISSWEAAPFQRVS